MKDTTVKGGNEMKKKLMSLLLCAAIAGSTLTGTATVFAEEEAAAEETANKEIDTLHIAFVPSREPEEIINGIETKKASRMATKCRCDPTLEATGMKCFSINAVNLSIIFSPLLISTRLSFPLS